MTLILKIRARNREIRVITTEMKKFMSRTEA